MANVLNRGCSEWPRRFSQCFLVIEFNDCVEDWIFNASSLVSASLRRRPIKLISSTTCVSLESKAPPLEVKSRSRLSVSSDVRARDVEIAMASVERGPMVWWYLDAAAVAGVGFILLKMVTQLRNSWSRSVVLIFWPVSSFYFFVRTQRVSHQ